MTTFWLQCASGRAWDFERPQARDVSLQDMAHALSRQARFNGHTISAVPYNVAHHSVLVAWRVEELLTSPKYDGIPERQWGAVDLATVAPQATLAALLHDAAEYVTGDWVSPLKSLLRAHWYGNGSCPLDIVETHTGNAIAEWAGLPSGEWLSLPVIKRADLELLATEARDVMAPAPRTWKPNCWEALPRRIDPWDWKKARDVFSDEFHRLRRASGLHHKCVTGASYAVEGMGE